MCRREAESIVVTHSVGSVSRQVTSKYVRCHSFRESLRDPGDRKVLPSSLPGGFLRFRQVRLVGECRLVSKAYCRRAGVLGDAFERTIAVVLVLRVLPDERAINPCPGLGWISAPLGRRRYLYATVGILAVLVLGVLVECRSVSNNKS